MRIVSCIFFLLIGFSCGTKNPDDQPAASYKGIILTKGELKSMLPKNLPTLDSARVTGLFIDQWIHEQMLMELAQSKIPDLETKLNFKLEDQKRKLAILELKTFFQEKESDTVHPDSVKAYYQTHTSEFLSTTNMYQCWFLSTENKDIPQVKLALSGNDPAAFSDLKEWCKKNAPDYKLDDSWIDEQAFEKIQNFAPKGKDLRDTKPGSPFVYMLTGTKEKPLHNFFVMRNVVKTGEPLPMEVAEMRIKARIINNQKNRAFDDFVKQSWNQLQKNEDYKIY